MIYFNFIIKSVIFPFLLASTLAASSRLTESVAYEGQLRIGKNESTIVYLGEETGDLAAFCFSNKSSVGRAVLSKCKNGEQCKFSGRVDWKISCSIKGNFSARAKIVSIRSVRKILRKKQI
jgi:hypothetical protein